MTDHHAQARELVRVLAGTVANLRADNSINAEAKKSLDLTATFLVKEFTAALLAVEQRVWEESAVYLDTEAKRFDHVDDGEAHMIRSFAAWCRAQATEAAQGME